MNDDQISAITRACEALSIAYARAVDFRDYDYFVTLFTEDGVLDTGKPREGRAAIADWETAIGNLQDAIEPDLSWSEFVTVLRGLTQGIKLTEVDEEAEVEGFAFSFNQLQSFSRGEIRRVDVGSSFLLPSRNIGSFSFVDAAL